MCTRSKIHIQQKLNKLLFSEDFKNDGANLVIITSSFCIASECTDHV